MHADARRLRPCGSQAVRHALDSRARHAEIKDHTGRFEVMDASYLLRRPARLDRSFSLFYPRALCASPSFICGKTLFLQCCQRTVTDVLTVLRCTGRKAFSTVKSSTDHQVRTSLQRHYRPPSTCNTCPFTNPASSDAKNTTALAMSRAVPNRFIAIRSISACCPSAP